MRALSRLLIGCAIVVLLPGSAAAAPVATNGVDPPDPARLMADHGNLPLAFEINHGQADAAVRFLARGPGYGIYLTSTEAVLSLRGRPSAQSRGDSDAVLRIRPVGANPQPRLAGEDLLPGTSSYFLGDDPSQWRRGVPNYAKVRYADVYRGIDLVYYGRQRQLEYDFVVAPGADPDRIVLEFDGIGKLSLDAHGRLVLATAAGEVVQPEPRVYQDIDGVRHMLDAHYRLVDERRAGFEIAAYDVSRTLVIDPLLEYSTYLGGGFAQGKDIAVDGRGNVYVTGETIGSPFPTTPGAYQTSFSGGGDAFVTKLNPAGNALVYSTYLGGPGTDFGHAIAVDATGNAYVTGHTSGGFPATSGTVQPLYGGGNADAFVAKLDPTGSALVYSTYLGGGGTDIGEGIAVDGHGDAYVTGLTDGGFPTTAGAFQTAYGGGDSDAFVAKLNAAGTAFGYSTYLGGPGFGAAAGIAVDADGNAFVVGVTGPGFPTTPGAVQTAHGGAAVNAFVTKLNAAGSAPVYSTYLGGRLDAGAGGIAVDGSGNAFVVGNAHGDFPTTPGALQVGYGGGFDDVFVTKLNPAGSALVYSTYLGGSESDAGYSIAIDTAGNAYVTGRSYGGFPTTPGAFQTAFGGRFDAFLAQLDATGSTLAYSTYLGGPDEDMGYGVAVDCCGNAYVTGVTRGGFPTTPGAYQPASSGALSDAFVVSVAGLASTKYEAIPLGTLGGIASSGYGISSNGQATGYALTRDGAQHAFIWSSGVMKDLGTLGGDYSWGYGINDRGEVAGASNRRAFLYSGGVMRDLGTLGGDSSEGHAINAAGQVVGRAATAAGPSHAFLYSNGTMVDLDVLNTRGSGALGVNAQGEAVGCAITSTGESQATLFARGTMTFLGTLGGYSSCAWAINARGQIVANGCLEGRCQGYRLEPIPGSAAPNYQGLWWNDPPESESGWGINLAHQGDVIFATWFTHDATGKAWWLSMTAERTGGNTYSGTLYESNGPPFSAEPFDPSRVTRTPVGTGTLTFASDRRGTFAYTVNGVSATKAIVPQAFGPLPTCLWGVPDLTLATNYQDLWWAYPPASEAGWGINFAHEGDVIFATWFTYGVDGKPLWMSATAPKIAERSYRGTLLATTGPPFGRGPFDSAAVTRTSVGTLGLSFFDGNAVSFGYRVELPGTPAVGQTRSLTRQVFRPPGTACY
jgi:probable HAF family extracellular repeat protein